MSCGTGSECSSITGSRAPHIRSRSVVARISASTWRSGGSRAWFGGDRSPTGIRHKAAVHHHVCRAVFSTSDTPIYIPYEGSRGSSRSRSPSACPARVAPICDPERRLPGQRGAGSPTKRRRGFRVRVATVRSGGRPGSAADGRARGKTPTSPRRELCAIDEPSCCVGIPRVNAAWGVDACVAREAIRLPGRDVAGLRLAGGREDRRSITVRGRTHAINDAGCLRSTSITRNARQLPHGPATAQQGPALPGRPADGRGDHRRDARRRRQP